MGDNYCMAHEGFDIRMKNVERCVESVDKRLTVIEKDTALDTQRLTLILDSMSESLPKLADAINSIEKTMLSMQTEIVKSGEKTETLEKNFGDKTDILEKKFDILDAKVTKIDYEGQFNIRVWIKENFIPIVCFVTGISGLIAWVSTLF